LSRRMARIERRDKRMSIIRVALLLLITLIAVGFVYKLGTSAIIAINKLGRDIRLVEYGTIEDKLDGKAIVLNQEKVTLAQYEGHFENLVMENAKIGKGTLLGYYANAQGKVSLRAAEAGVFVRHTDGLEEVFSNIDLQAVTPEVYEYKITRVSEDQLIQPGQPIYKIVDNLAPPQLLVRFPLDDIDFEIKDQSKVKVLLQDNELGKAAIVAMKQDFGELIMLLELESFSDAIINQRYIEVAAVFDSATGFLIPKKALVDNDGKKGIYCSIGEFTRFKPVEVIKTKDDIVIVKGLDRNDFIVTNPPDKM